MAEGSSKDVNEMFKKMGEKLGWFQHKDLETALKSLSKSTKKKQTKARTEGPEHKPVKKKEHSIKTSKVEKQSQPEDDKELQYPIKRTQAHTNLPKALGIADICNSGKHSMGDSNNDDGGKHTMGDSNSEDDGKHTMGDSNNKDGGKGNKHKAVINGLDFSSSDEEEKQEPRICNIHDTYTGKSHKSKILSESETCKVNNKTISSALTVHNTVIGSCRTENDDSISEKIDVKDTYVSCVGESFIENDISNKEIENNNLDCFKKPHSKEKQVIKLSMDQTTEFSVDDTIVQKPIRVSSESFSPDIDSTFGEPQGESTRIHRRSSVTYKNLVGSPEDLNSSGTSDDKHYETCRANLSADDVFDVSSESENPLIGTAVVVNGNHGAQDGNNDRRVRNEEERKISDSLNQQSIELCEGIENLSVTFHERTPKNAEQLMEKEKFSENACINEVTANGPHSYNAVCGQGSDSSVEVVDASVQTDASLAERSSSPLQCSVTGTGDSFSMTQRKISGNSSGNSSGCISEDKSDLQSNISEVEVNDISVQTDAEIITREQGNMGSNSDLSCPESSNSHNTNSMQDKSNNDDLYQSVSKNVQNETSNSKSGEGESPYYSMGNDEVGESDSSCEENASLISDKDSSEDACITDDLEPSNTSEMDNSKNDRRQHSDARNNEEAQRVVDNVRSSSSCSPNKIESGNTDGNSVDNIPFVNGSPVASEVKLEAQTTWRQKKLSVSSSDDDLDAYFEKLRNPKKKSTSPESSPVSMKDFIVDDDDMSSESDDSAFYMRENNKLEETPLIGRLKKSANINFSDSDDSDFSSDKYPGSVTKYKKRQITKPKARSNSWSLSDDDDLIPVDNRPTQSNKKTSVPKPGSSKKTDTKHRNLKKSEKHGKSENEEEKDKKHKVAVDMLPDSDEELLFKTPKPLLKKSKNNSNKENKPQGKLHTQKPSHKAVNELDVKEEKKTKRKRETQKVNSITFSDSDDDGNDCDIISDESVDLPEIKPPVLKESVFNTKIKSRSLTDNDDLFRTPSSVLKGSQSKFYTPQPVKARYSFLKSLSVNIQDHLRDPEAARFVSGFKKRKEELSQHLFRFYNQSVFDNQLPADLPIEWNKRLLRTAGYCTYKKSSKNPEDRSVRIELSTKVCDSAERVRDTLIHELCHAAVWLINGTRDGHGQYWKYWARKSNQVHPEIPVIARCHDYSINTKYTYQCTQCGYSIGRHSKSLDTEKKVCGYCHGQFELLQNSGSLSTSSDVSSTPKTPRTPNRFALYVKEHYSAVKKKDKSLKHGDVMRELSKQFAEMNKI